MAMAADFHAQSLLFPMESLFESFVAQYLKQQLGTTQVSTQLASKQLVSYNDKHYFMLKPDLLVSGGQYAPVIMDTKWKLIDQTKTSGKDKFGMSQADFYQMLAYGHKYLEQAGKLVLIYPKTEQFTEPLPHTFDFDTERNLQLRVVPFDISYSCQNRINLTEIWAS
jgi:5-methylcytosine-specific restriction enzyme subunit McrC